MGDNQQHLERAVRKAEANGRLPMEPIFVTTAEAAAVIGVSRQTIHAWVKSGDVPSVKVGGTYRIPASWLYGLIEQARGATAS